MTRGRLRSYRARVIAELEAAFSEERPPREIAASFSIGIFVTALPTLGTGLVLFVVLVAAFDWIHRLALFASVVVLNPVVKWGVYAASFTLGVLLFGPVDGVTMQDVSLSAGPEVVLRLVVGNVVIAVAFAIVAYVVALRTITEARRRNLEPEDVIPEPMLE